LCRDFTPARCERLVHPPFCCNGCLKFRNCTIRRFTYDAEKAHGMARARLRDVRSGILLSETELSRTDLLVSPFLRNGQSVHHIYLSHKDELFCSEKNLYNLIDQGLLSAKNLDLRLKVKRRIPRRKPEHKVDRVCRIGRSFADYRQLLDCEPDLPVVQMDSVIGSKESVKVLLTLFFPRAQLLLCRIRDYNTARSALDAIDALEGLLGEATFRRLFPVLLTDNGSEFSDPNALERGQRTRVFYCDPMQTNQKSGIERAHEFIRMVRTKGSSFDDLRQQDIDKLCSHINSYRRDSLIGKCPFDVFEYLYGEGILDKFGIKKIEADGIVLSPRLLQLPH
jgi:IS30 family transposase